MELENQEHMGNSKSTTNGREKRTRKDPKVEIVLLDNSVQFTCPWCAKEAVFDIGISLWRGNPPPINHGNFIIHDP